MFYTKFYIHMKYISPNYIFIKVKRPVESGPSSVWIVIHHMIPEIYIAALRLSRKESSAISHQAFGTCSVMQKHGLDKLLQQTPAELPMSNGPSSNSNQRLAPVAGDHAKNRSQNMTVNCTSTQTYFYMYVHVQT